MDEGIQFYDDSNSDLIELADIVDNKTLILYIETPEGWKCERCPILAKHVHDTFKFIEK